MSDSNNPLYKQGQQQASSGMGPRNDFGSNAVAKQIYDNGYNNAKKS